MMAKEVKQMTIVAMEIDVAMAMGGSAGSCNIVYVSM
jgi:hypothetical protein